MKSVIRLFDRLLRRAYRIFELCSDPTCLLRVRRTTAFHAVTLPDRRIPDGAPVLDLHLWNEHIPPFPPGGPDLAWAVRTRRRLAASLRALAGRIPHDPRLADIQAVQGIIALPMVGDGAGPPGLFERLGFTTYPHRGPLGGFGEFWAHLYTWAIMWAFNEPSLATKRLARMRRQEIWMSTGDFVRRFGNTKPRRTS